jgi:hypothetical protein
MSYQDYYFEKQSDVLFVDEEAQAVGILNPSPIYTLDVNGTINSSNIISINHVSDYIEGSNAIINTIEGDNANIDNINCLRVSACNVTACNLVSLSNLKLLNTFISDQCPVPSEGSLFGFSLGGGVIDPSWIKTDDDFAETLNSLWNLAQSGYDLFNLAQNVLDPSSELGEGLKEAINKALSNGSLRVPWGSVNYKPIYGSPQNNIGIDGNVYMNETKAIYSLPAINITTINDGFNVNVITTSGAEKVLDFNTREAFLKQLTSSNITCSNLSASNVIIKSNVDVPRITASNTITSNASIIDTLRIGDYYIKPNGIYVGNPAFPLTSQLVIDSQGNYKGTIDRNQITNLEAFNLSALGDGQLLFGNFGQTNALNDPFANLAPLFNVG